tara:strand:- start:325 stop:675 length:351 start_codon:yes stop_codon:yes gene_type:complete
MENANIGYLTERPGLPTRDANKEAQRNEKGGGKGKKRTKKVRKDEWGEDGEEGKGTIPLTRVGKEESGGGRAGSYINISKVCEKKKESMSPVHAKKVQHREHCREYIMAYLSLLVY